MGIMKITKWLHRNPNVEYIPSEDRWWCYPLVVICFLSLCVGPMILVDRMGIVGAGLVSGVLVVMAGFIVSLYGTIQVLRKELDDVRARKEYYEYVWDQLNSKRNYSVPKEWFNEPFCKICWEFGGKYWLIRKSGKHHH